MAYDTETAAYKELCKKVRKIDEKAADYMEGLLAAHERGETSSMFFRPDSRLGGSFIWSETPQGHWYWRALDERLDDASSYPTAAPASAPAAAEKFPVGTMVRLCVNHDNPDGKGPSVGATGTVRRKAAAEAKAAEEARKAQEQAEAAARAWDSVKGQDVAKQALREAVELPVLYSGLYAAYGKKASKGALLYGPPGCGKTMLGRMMAQAIGGGEEGFRYVKGGELFDRMVGAEEKQIREIFSEAKKYKARTGKPQVVFFDEADALFPKRTGKADRGHSYDFMASTMGAFLSELDGMEDSGAFVILATNRQEVLDPALLRDGRIDRKIMVERPNREVCGDILRSCLSCVPGFEERFVDATLDEVYSPKRTYYIAETEDKGNVRITFGSSVSGAVITGIAQRIINEALQRDIKAGSTVATGICEKDIHAAVEAAWRETLGLDLTWLVEEVVGAVKISNLRTVHGRWLGIHGSESNKPKLEITVNHNLNDGSEDKF